MSISEEEELYVTLELDDDTNMECRVIAIYPVKDKQYIALEPTSGDDENLYFFRFEQIGEEEGEIINIESDEEFEAAAEAYDALEDDEAWNVLMDEEEDEE